MIILCSGCVEEAPRSIRRFSELTTKHGICRWCGALGDQTFADAADAPMLASNGVWLTSTSLALDRVRTFVWDVNGYYRRLGVRTDATREEIRDRYVKVDGVLSADLTWIARVLLSVSRRRTYDALQPGDLYWDPVIEHSLKMQIIDEAAHARSHPRMNDIFEPDEMESGGDSLGIDFDAEPESSDNRVIKAPKSFTPPMSTSWGWFVWRVGVEGSAELAASWRLQLSLELAEIGRPVDHVGIGIARWLDGGRDWEVKKFPQGWTVFFASDTVPDRAIAKAAAQGLHQSITASTQARIFVSTHG